MLKYTFLFIFSGPEIVYSLCFVFSDSNIMFLHLRPFILTRLWEYEFQW